MGSMEQERAKNPSDDTEITFVTEQNNSIIM